MYEVLNIGSRLVVHLGHLCELLISNNQLEQLQCIMNEWDYKIDHHHAAHLYKTITLRLMQKKIVVEDLQFYLKKTIDYLSLDKHSTILQKFLSTIEALHNDYYHEVTMHVQEL